MEKAQENKSIFDLLKKLADIQFNRAKVGAAEFAKRGKNLVANKVNDMRECILESANEYNQRIEFVEGTKTIKSAMEANILRNYELSLSAAKREYEAMYNGIAKEKGNLEIIENTAMMRQAHFGKLLEEEKKKPEYAKREELKKQAKEAIDNGDNDKAATLIDEIRILSNSLKADEYEKEYKENLLTRKRVEEQRAKWEKILDGLYDEERKAIEIIAGKKENLLKTSDEKYLAVVGKQGLFKKIFGKLANMFLSGKKYSENVIKVLSDKVENTQKLMPDLAANVREKMQVGMADYQKIKEAFEKRLKEDEKEAEAAQRDNPADVRSKKMRDINREEEKAAAEEEGKEQKVENKKEESKETIEPKKEDEQEIKFIPNERVNPWKTDAMRKSAGAQAVARKDLTWRVVGKGKKLSIDKRKAGLEKDDGDER